ncbi:hypothetical protein LXM94_23805 [Rhizobium sp. TRM95111]|uniref:hypothetical protein n=1 Tax=Rhizobium alarense TaxID=2846851 RepID=UPI001F40A469|nr:hypothetical protein [Rhizobium alarense]MCF3642992.1 hypothetical protein [Rhizobium alarense]
MPTNLAGSPFPRRAPDLSRRVSWQTRVTSGQLVGTLMRELPVHPDLTSLQTDRRNYQALMSEVKARIFAIRAILDHGRDLHPQIVTETCDLQLRLCCECIALACLAVHRSLAGSTANDIMKAYQPGVIMKRLARLHPDFYPVPWNLNVTDSGWHLTADQEALASFLSSKALIDLWENLGRGLHKGSLKSLLTAERPVANDHPVLDQQLDALTTFLRMHTIMSHDRSHVIICEGLMDKPDVGVHCSLAIAQG